MGKIKEIIITNIDLNSREVTLSTGEIIYIIPESAYLLSNPDGTHERYVSDSGGTISRQGGALIDAKVKITENTNYANVGNTQKDFNRNIASKVDTFEEDINNSAQDITNLKNRVTTEENKSTDHEIRVSKLEGLKTVWTPSTKMLTLYDRDNRVLSDISLVSLDDEGTDFRYNPTTKALELWNAQGQLLDSIPVYEFIGNVGTALSLGGNTLQLKDSQGNVLSSVNFVVSNISGLQTTLDNLQTNINTEITNRTNADTNLQNQINTNTTGLATEITDRTNADNLKIDKPNTTITDVDTTWQYITILDVNGNSRRITITNFRKNIGNTDLTLNSARVLSQGGFTYTHATGGAAYNITGLPDKSADASFDKLLGLNSAGQIASVDGKTAFMNMPSKLTATEKNNWLASMNSLVSYSGALVTQSVPPILARNSQPQNIIIRGNGLNLPSNSYVGLIKPDGSDYNSMGYSVVGNNQEIISTFLIDNNYPLGNSKVKILSGGVLAVGDVYLTVVENIQTIPFIGAIKTRDNIVSSVNSLISNSTAVLQSDNAIYPLGDPTIPISSFYTDASFKGNEDWWITMKVKVGMVNNHSSRNYQFKFGLVKDGLNPASNPADTLILPMVIWSLYANNGTIGTGYYGAIFNGQDSGTSSPLILNGLTIQYIKMGTVLTAIATFPDGRNIIVNQAIDTFSNYGISFLQMNGYTNYTKHSCEIISAYKLN